MSTDDGFVWKPTPQLLQVCDVVREHRTRTNTHGEVSRGGSARAFATIELPGCGRLVVDNRKRLARAVFEDGTVYTDPNAAQRAEIFARVLA